MAIVASHSPEFDFSSLLEQKIIEQSKVWDAFGTSPLSSVSSSPSTTPPTSPLLHPSLEGSPSPSSPNSTLLSLPDELLEPIPLDLSGPGSLPVPQASTPKQDRREKRKAAHKTARRRKRAEKAATSFGQYTVRQRVLELYVQGTPSISTNFVTEDSKVDGKGFVGTNKRGGMKKVYRLDELVGPGSKNFGLVEWDGKAPTSIVDSQNRIVAVLAGHPTDSDWPAMHREAAQALEERRPRCSLPKAKKKRHHRRGAFLALQCGVSHGGGQIRPRNLYNVPANKAVLDELNNLRPFKRIAGFASSVLACQMPLLHDHYADKLGKLFKNDQTLKQIFPSTVFPGASYNFGPQTVCYPHTDFGNLAGGMCAVTPVGDYDHTKGGHLVLWECRLVIQFPPGSTILLASAIVTHSNTSIQPHEARYSFALYAAGALFRWVENGFQKSADYYASLSLEQHEVVEAANKARWKHGLSLLPTVEIK